MRVYPGLEQRRLEHIHPMPEVTLDTKAGEKTSQPATAIRCNLFGFVALCGGLYFSITKSPVESLGNVATPSIDDHPVKREERKGQPIGQRRTYHYEDALWS